MSAGRTPLSLKNKIEALDHKQYLIDYYGYYRFGADPLVAVIILNRNLPDITDRLCSSIIDRSGVSYDLFVMESGSDPGKLSRYCSFHFVDAFSVNVGLRIARGLNTGLELVNRVNPGRYRYYWFLTNDVGLKDDCDYIGAAAAIFEKFPQVGLIEPCFQPDRLYTLNYRADTDDACLEKLGDRENYSPFIKEKQFSIIPFPIIRSLFLGRRCRESLGYVLDESNWRNWGNDEDLGFRAWQKGWWVATLPYCSSWEDVFLTVKRCADTRTEDVDTFKKEAEAEMHRFLQDKYNTGIREFRVRIYKEMLKHLEAFRVTGVDIAHCIDSGAGSIYKLIRDIRRL